MYIYKIIYILCIYIIYIYINIYLYDYISVYVYVVWRVWQLLPKKHQHLVRSIMPDVNEELWPFKSLCTFQDAHLLCFGSVLTTHITAISPQCHVFSTGSKWHCNIARCNFTSACAALIFSVLTLSHNISQDSLTLGSRVHNSIHQSDHRHGIHEPQFVVASRRFSRIEVRIV